MEKGKKIEREKNERRKDESVRKVMPVIYAYFQS